MYRELLISVACLCAFFTGCRHDITTGNAVREDGIVVSPGTTIYGKVLCGDTPVEGVVVSDGVDVTATDSRGVYMLASAKKNGLVFISIPGGYRMPKTLSPVPSFWKRLAKGASEAERVDFSLVREEQQRHTMMALGDIHLYSSPASSQFVSLLVTELNCISPDAVTGPVYGITMGDMTWDMYWYRNNFGIVRYLADLSRITGITVFSTVGNHDNDMQYDSKTEFLSTGEDWKCMSEYRRYLGPTCWSCNIGDIHYVSLDDVITVNTGGISDMDSRGCWRGVSEVDMEWLRKDLSYVDSSTPVIVSIHIPLYNASGTSYTSSSSSVNSTVSEIVAPFARFDKVLFLSAHTHTLYSNVKKLGDMTVTEWNTGAVCGNFWTCAVRGLDLCVDGTPGGYRVVRVDGKEISSVYKAIGKSEDYFFRAYDRNEMNLPYDAAYTKDYYGVNTDNWIYLNVWDYKEGWTVSVTENGVPLEVTQFSSYDPLYMLMYCDGLSTTRPAPCLTLFKAKATSRNSSVIITVTDEYGNVGRRTMARPKTFSLQTYILEQ